MSDKNDSNAVGDLILYKDRGSLKKQSDKSVGHWDKKHFAKYKKPFIELPDLYGDQVESFKWLIKDGIKEILDEFSPIKDYSDKKFELSFVDFQIEEPKYDPLHAKANHITYEAPLKVNVKLFNKTLGTEKEQEIFMADFPMMTRHGTFIINGIERVIVPQLARSFGVIFTANIIKGKKYFGAKIIPARGAWIEFETDADDIVYVRIDKNRKFPVSSFLRVMGAKTDEDILKLFKKNEHAKKGLELTLEKDETKNIDESFLDIYKRLRDGDLATLENAKEFVSSILDEERYDFSAVGRYKFNNRFGLPTDKKTLTQKTITIDDVALIINHMIEMNHTHGAHEDDIDHLGSRRVRFVGELLQQKIRTGMVQMKRNIQNRMSTIESDTSLPVNFISPRPLQARIKEFFTTNQLSQFIQQDNVLQEIEHLRTVSALGPGGLSRERAGLEVRDVHPSHYGRLCPIQTPEGPNIGLILRFTNFARTNHFGMIETPYLKVDKGVITKEIVYLNALEEEQYKIADAGVNYNEKGEILDKYVDARIDGRPEVIKKNEVDFMDVATNQAFSIATSMIPFLNHDEANRALMASNMQKQAVPCVHVEAPLVSTGTEELALKQSSRIIRAEEEGVVESVDAKKIVIKNAKGKKTEYQLVNFERTNSFTCSHQRPVVSPNQKVKKGQLLADTSSTDNGQIALGQNVLVAFMSWSGSNYEDAIIISERLVKENIFSSVHMEEVVVNVRDTKLGPEVTTADIPNVSDTKLRNLDEEGIIRIGAEVRPGDILVGKITPKGETQLTPEERLLRSIFGDKARDVKDTSKRVESGKRGRVIGVKVFSRENGDKLESGIIKRIHIEVAELRRVTVGDKLAGRHGNKGVIAKVLPEADMPYAEDGTPIDVILTPLGVPSRMNLGQILEIHLGLAAKTLGFQAVVPAFAGATDEEIQKELEEAGFDKSGKMTLYDGRTGEKFDKQVSVGYMYILKLHHMVEDKIHMRSIGPYSLITQQPLGGRAQNGGQRFGEMEVWALLGHGAAHTLREVLTYKSDDIQGRSVAFDSIVKGEPIRQANIPASFNVLVNNLRGLGLDVEMKKSGEEDNEDNN
ncbi:DNA-directed RNA polymerase subunit beta [Candidatus Nomurabacteria bacterium]|nr:DNA-directed RNA polymerase subunit beta [Candidatus Nomurabacteria bacterium]